jgi:hypothetical protein
LNRRLGHMFSLTLWAQALLSVAGWLANVPIHDTELLIPALWGLSYAMLAVWGEKWFAVPAVTCAVALLVSAVSPRWMYPLMSLDNLMFTVVLVRVWLPREDVARIEDRRRRMHGRAQRWLREAVHGGGAAPERKT